MWCTINATKNFYNKITGTVETGFIGRSNGGWIVRKSRNDLLKEIINSAFNDENNRNKAQKTKNLGASKKK